MRAIEIAKAVFPEADEAFINFVLFEKTGFPCFWRIPEDGNTPEDCLRKQLLDFKRSIKIEEDDLK